MYLRAALPGLFRLLLRRPPTFSFSGQTYTYFFARYNVTWMNERSVEIPIAMEALELARSSNILEVGNVTSRYRPELRHDIVDRYEKGNPRVRNHDARTFAPSKLYDLILSVSTLEHVGWDENPREPEKAWQTIRHLSSLLAPEGRLLLTIPAGYHPALDLALLNGNALLESLRALKRKSIWNDWKECSPTDAVACHFGRPYPFANALLVCSIRAGCVPATS